MKRLILLAIVFLITTFGASSQTFTVRLNDGNQLCCHVSDTTRREAEIIRIKVLGNTQPSHPSGDLSIPSSVNYKGFNYTVTSVGENAFAESDGLSSISIPSSVQRIADKAFSGCSSLKSIVFPSKTPSFGENVFEHCTSVSAISFGSDWTTVDLHLFADAVSLKEVFIPSRVTKITGVKSIGSLEKIVVDANNKAFSSDDGILYSKDGITLYACPRAKKGAVSVLPGTETILDGAFSDCIYIESILLPVSVHEFAFDEFIGCKGVKSIILLSEIPPMTAKWNGATVFAIAAPNQDCILQVSKKHLKRYQTSICSTEGVYETLKGNRKADIVPEKMMSKASIKKQ